MRFFDVENSLDYYSFGMLMPERFSSSSDYRYGFNGQEKDDDVSGEGNSYTATYWQYDSRLGRRWNVDPLTYSWHSPYVTFNNNPVYYSDPLGLKGEPPVKISKVEAGTGAKERHGMLSTSPQHGESHVFSYNDDDKTEITYTYSSTTLVWTSSSTKVIDGNRVDTGLKSIYSPTIKKGNGGAIFVAFPNTKAKIGSSDNSPIAQLARKYGLGNKKFRVGHAGVIVFDGKGNTTYADFGRFKGSTRGNGITRYGLSNLSTSNASFDMNGSISNAQEVVSSLISGYNYFASHKYGGKIMYSTIQGLNYESMTNYINGVGSMQFGFGDGRNYCAQFACNVLKAGGATQLKVWNIQALMNQANQIMNDRGLLGLPQALKLVNEGPTGENIINDINNNYKQSNGSTGTIKF